MNRRWRATVVVLGVVALLTAVVLALAEPSAPRVWHELAPGLDLGRFSSAARATDPRGDLVVLRVDPALWELRFRLASDHDDRTRTARAWTEEFDLVAAINGGMYQADHRNHVGFLQLGGVVRNRHANDYLSAAVFGPRRAGDPPFAIVDLDETPLDSLRVRYDDVVQNLRLIKRRGVNRWTAQEQRWTEAALGEDTRGNALLVYCGSSLSMHDLNTALLALPLDLVCAQHLEGNLPAQLHVAAPGLRLSLPEGGEPPPIPNILGVKRRT